MANAINVIAVIEPDRRRFCGTVVERRRELAEVSPAEIEACGKEMRMDERKPDKTWESTLR